jgi:hypothetical protein
MQNRPKSFFVTGIDPRSIKKVYAFIYSMFNKSFSLMRAGKPHTAKTQNRDFISGQSVNAVLQLL